MMQLGIQIILKVLPMIKILKERFELKIILRLNTITIHLRKLLIILAYLIL